MKHKSIKVKNSNLVLFVFAFICVTIISLTVGFASSSTSLAINGSLLVRPLGDVRITNIAAAEVNYYGGYINPPTYGEMDFTTSSMLTDYRGSVSYRITVTNLSSSSVVITDASNILYSNDKFSYSFSDMEINKTVIPAASEYTFTVKFTFSDSTIAYLTNATEEERNAFFSDEANNTLYANILFGFYKKPKYTFTLSTLPNVADITLKSGDEVVTGVGSASIEVEEGTTVEWSTHHYDYYDESGSETINSDLNKEINLEKRMPYTFTIIPEPSDSVVTIKFDGEVKATGSGTQSVTVLGETQIEYTVSKFEYYDKAETYMMPRGDSSINVVLDLLPYAVGTFTNTNRNSALTEELDIHHPGYYLVELWGGKGGDYLRASSKNVGYAGAVGYVYGVVYLDYNSKIYFTLGGNGRDGQLTSNSSGGANGGGNGYASYTGGGGGYSAFAYNTTTIDNSTIESGNVLMIAAGSGGGAGSSLVSGKPGNGGNGGTIGNATTSIGSGIVFHGTDGILNDAKSSCNGLGATTTSNRSSSGGDAGKMLDGGNSAHNGGGGGAGYFGGSGGGCAGTLSSNQAGGGGGGSSFIANSVTFSGLSADITSKLTSSNPSSTGGAIVISYLGKTL